MIASARPSLRFGDFEVDEAAGELRRGGVAIPLAPQPFKLLVLLASRQGRLVTREEIQRELWPEGVYVDFEQSLHFAVRQVREALGDSADQPQYVKTLPRRGYRFIAAIERAGAPPSRRALTDVNLQKALWANIAELRLAEARRRRWLMGIAALVMVLIALMAVR